MLLPRVRSLTTLLPRASLHLARWRLPRFLTPLLRAVPRIGRAAIMDYRPSRFPWKWLTSFKLRSIHWILKLNLVCRLGGCRDGFFLLTKCQPQDGMIYLPEIKYRRILNKAFGPGGWGLAPRSETNVGPKIV